MNKVLIAFGVIGMLMIIVSVVVVVRYQLYPPPFEGVPFEIKLSDAQAKAEIDRLAGIKDKELKVSLGKMASAAESCVSGSLSKRPSDAVLAAARRFFLAVYAMRDKVDSPLIDPRTRDISLKGPPSLDALVETWRKEGRSKATIERWQWILDFYTKLGHPIYVGIGLKPGGWEKADLDNLFVAVKLEGSNFANCVRSRAGA